MSITVVCVYVCRYEFRGVSALVVICTSLLLFQVFIIILLFIIILDTLGVKFLHRFL